jgi:hypothetical protein
MFASGAAFVLPVALVEVLVVFGTAAVGSGCCSNNGTSAALFFTATSLANAVVGAITAWGVHRALGGQGKISAALGGMFAAAMAAAGFFALHAHAPPAGGLFGPSSLSVIPVSLISLMIFSVGAPVGAEWSSAEAPKAEREPDEDEPRRRRAPVDMQVRLGGLNGGGMLSLTGTF